MASSLHFMDVVGRASLASVDPASGLRTDGSVSLAVNCECGRSTEVQVALARGEGERASVSHKTAPDVPPFVVRVLRLVGRGRTDREIAASLEVSVSQVKHAVRHALVRLCAHNRTEAVMRAAAAGLLDE